MENNNTKKIEEEIRQYKLYKIQTTEAKIREYNEIFASIKENVLIKFTKNSISNIIRFVLILISIGFFILSVILIFPEFAISIMERNGEIITQAERKDFIIILPFLGYIILGLALLFGIVTSLLRKNIQKRNTIYNLAKLLDEVIDYMSNNTKEEKIKYENYIENLVDLDTKNNKSDNDKTPHNNVQNQ